MSVPQRVVVDTNIIFSALVSGRSNFADVLLTSGHQFFVCELTLVELFKHRNKIIKASRLSEEDVVRLYSLLLRRLSVYKEELISSEHRRLDSLRIKEVAEGNFNEA